MRTLILLPGILGSRLARAGTEVWPPTVLEAVAGYGRIADLMSSDVRPTDVIRSVACQTFYGSLIDQLKAWGFPEGKAGAGGRLVCFPYDWRIDVRDAAAALSERMRSAVGAEFIGKIALLAHSMGGLVARYALEANDPKRLGDTAWREQVDVLVTFGTPHRGAPLALVRALGMEGTSGLSGEDCKTFSSDPRFPSLCQLLPTCDARAVWADTPAMPLTPVDVLDAAAGAGFGLNPITLQAAREFHATLDAGRRPACRYFNFVGRSLSTVVRCRVNPAGQRQGVSAVSFSGGGDGTCPAWSGTQPDTQFDFEGDEHSKTFNDPNVLAILGQLLEVPAGLVGLVAAAAPALRVSLPAALFPAGAMTKATVRTAGASGRSLLLNIHETDPGGTLIEPPVASRDVAQEIQGDHVSMVDVLVPARPGLYAAIVRMTADGGAEIQSDPFSFVAQRTVQADSR